MLRYNGADWTGVDVSTDSYFANVWGSAATDVYVVGSVPGTGFNPSGVILHYDGSSWTTTDAPVALSGVWGSGPDDVWTVGVEGTVLHYNGTEWSQVRGGMGRDLYGLHGFPSGTVYAAGASIVLRSYGSGWDIVVADKDSPHHAIWGESENDLFVVGGGINYIMRIRTGGRWSGQDVPGGWGTYRGVWGSKSSDVFAGGSRLMHFNGVSWTVMMGATANLQVADVWGSSPTDVYAVQDGVNPGMLHYDGTGWTTVALPDVEWEEGHMGQPYLTGLWGSSATDIFAVGAPGAILPLDGQGWTAMDGGPMSSSTRSEAALPRTSTPSVKTSPSSTSIVRPGVPWTCHSDCRVPLHDVWLRNGSDVLIVGEAGTILRGIRQGPAQPFLFLV